MIVELALATAMVLVTAFLHGVGLLALGRMLAWRDRRRGQMRLSPLSIEGAMVAMALVVGLLILHGVEIWLYAFLFHGIGAVGSLRDAVYFSTLSYASVGYSDDLMLERWRLLGALEGINGALLLGWSVAFFVTVMTRFTPRRRGS